MPSWIPMLQNLQATKRNIASSLEYAGAGHGLQDQFVDFRFGNLTYGLHCAARFLAFWGIWSATLIKSCTSRLELENIVPQIICRASGNKDKYSGGLIAGLTSVRANGIVISCPRARGDPGEQRGDHRRPRFQSSRRA